MSPFPIDEVRQINLFTRQIVRAKVILANTLQKKMKFSHANQFFSTEDRSTLYVEFLEQDEYDASWNFAQAFKNIMPFLQIF